MSDNNLIADKKNPYSPYDQSSAHYSKELLNVEFPAKLEEGIEQADFTSDTKSILKKLTSKLDSHELLLASNDKGAIDRARADYNLERIFAELLIDPLDIYTPEYVMTTKLCEHQVDVELNRTLNGKERQLQSMTITRIEESVNAEQETQEKRSLVGSIIGKMKGGR
jgi:hypothetical protein